MNIYTAYNLKKKGGAYTLWQRLVVELGHSPNHTVTYVAPESIPEADSTGVTFVRLGASNPQGRWAAVIFLVELFFSSCFNRGKLSAGSIAISQGNLYSLALLPLTWHGVRLVTLIHGDYGLEYDLNGYPGWLKKPIQAFVRMSYHRSHLVLPISEDLQKRTMRDYGLPAEQFHVVSNSVPAIEPSSPAEQAALRTAWEVGIDQPLVTFVGALSPIKRVDVLLNAWALIPATSRPQLRIVGDGPLRLELEAQAKSLGLSSQVQFVGEMADIRSRLAAVDLLVLCSDYEGCPTVLMEALANGVPVVATRVGGVPEILGLDDLLVAPDDPPALAATIQAFFHRPEGERAALHKAWLEYADAFRIPWEQGVIEVLDDQLASGTMSHTP